MRPSSAEPCQRCLRRLPSPAEPCHRRPPSRADYCHRTLPKCRVPTAIASCRVLPSQTAEYCRVPTAIADCRVLPSPAIADCRLLPILPSHTAETCHRRLPSTASPAERCRRRQPCQPAAAGPQLAARLMRSLAVLSPLGSSPDRRDKDCRMLPC